MSPWRRPRRRPTVAPWQWGRRPWLGPASSVAGAPTSGQGQGHISPVIVLLCRCPALGGVRGAHATGRWRMLLDLFSGTGGLSRAARSRAWKTEEWEILQDRCSCGPWHDSVPCPPIAKRHQLGGHPLLATVPRRTPPATWPTRPTFGISAAASGKGNSIGSTWVHHAHPSAAGSS